MSRLEHPGQAAASRAGPAVRTGPAGDGRVEPAGTAGPATEAPPALAQVLLDRVEEATLLVDAAGIVRAVNAPARRLAPAMRAGHTLASAGPLGAGLTADPYRADIDLDGLRLRVRRVDLGSAGTAWYLRDVSQDTARTDALLAERARAAFLAEASRRLGASLHRGRTARVIATLAVPTLADCAVVVLPPKAGRVRVTRYDDSGAEVAAGRVRAGLLREVPALAEALDGATIDGDPRLTAELARATWLFDERFGPPGESLVLPMPGNGVAVGALILVRRPGRPGFEPAEAAMTQEYAARAGLALAAATLYTDQVETSTVLQASLRPPELGTLAGASVGAAYRPARETLHIGGDFYDVIGPHGHDPLVVLGDVCGKGVDAAVLTGQVRQSLHALHQVERRPLQLLELLNQAMLATGATRFATLVLGQVSTLPNGGLRLRLAGGGHPPPLVLRADGTVDEVRIGGMPVGVLDDAEFGEVSVRLAPGEVCLMYSDGVTEARGGPQGREEFGHARLVEQLAGCRGMPVGALVERIEQLASEWLDGRDHDDIAVLGVQALPRGQRIAGGRRLWSVPDVSGVEGP